MQKTALIVACASLFILTLSCKTAEHALAPQEKASCGCAQKTSCGCKHEGKDSCQEKECKEHS